MSGAVAAPACEEAVHIESAGVGVAGFDDGKRADLGLKSRVGQAPAMGLALPVKSAAMGGAGGDGGEDFSRRRTLAVVVIAPAMGLAVLVQGAGVGRAGCEGLEISFRG